VPAVLQVGEQVAGALEGGDLADQPHVVLLLGRADAVPETLLDLVAADRRDQLVAAHADVPTSCSLGRRL
jgi:hypothetical protein